MGLNLKSFFKRVLSCFNARPREKLARKCDDDLRRSCLLVSHVVSVTLGDD